MGAAILPEVLDAVRGTELEAGSSIGKLSRLPPDVQRRIAEHLRDGNLIAARVTLNVTEAPPNTSTGLPRTPTKEVRRELGRLDKAWTQACAETQQRFLNRLRRKGVSLG